jgi:UDP-glucose 6-dehydrogenase
VLGLSFKEGTPVTLGSPAFEFIARLTRQSLRIFAYDPLTEAREQTHAAFGAAITCCQTLAEATAAADTILICRPDPSFAGLSQNIALDRWIVDPWGCIRNPHPGLVRPGRLPLVAKPTSTAIRGTLEPAEAK